MICFSKNINNMPGLINGGNHLRWFIFCILLSLVAPLLEAQSTNTTLVEYLKKLSGGQSTNTTLEEYLKKLSAKSYEESVKAYQDTPLDIADDFNNKVGTTLGNENVTRRHLKEDDCEFMNPMDQCWRCDPNWSFHRKRLADCGLGFGRNTVGGKHGKYYVVNDPSDDDVENPRPGTLRHAVIQPQPLWIIFDRSMVITLKEELIMTNHKTIDGRGVQVQIAYGGGLTIQFIHNVIIHNIWIHDIISTPGGMIRDALAHIGLRTRSDGDGISIFSSHHIWIDHVTLANGTDGLIDVIEGSTAITISNCKFNNHDSVMLLGANDNTDKDLIMQVTVAFNRFGKGLVQRMPRVRWGFAHVVNNDYSRWGKYAIGGSANPTIISQGNRFRASDDPFTKEVTKRIFAPQNEWIKWQWRSEGDMFHNGAYFVESGPPIDHEKHQTMGKIFVKFRPSSFVGRLTQHAGAIKCRMNKPC